MCDMYDPNSIHAQISRLTVLVDRMELALDQQSQKYEAATKRIDVVERKVYGYYKYVLGISCGVGSIFAVAEIMLRWFWFWNKS